MGSGLNHIFQAYLQAEAIAHPNQQKLVTCNLPLAEERPEISSLQSELT